MSFKSLFLTPLLFSPVFVFAQGQSNMRHGLSDWQSPKDAEETWSKYCQGKWADPTVIPKPNYSNKLIINRVVRKMMMVDPRSYYLYPDVVRTYGLGTGKELFTPANKLPNGVSKETNAFLVYLCGEFRDRPRLIEEKLNWIAKIQKLPLQKSKHLKDFDTKANIWSQMTAEDYSTWLRVLENIFSLKEIAAKGQKQYEDEPATGINDPEIKKNYAQFKNPKTGETHLVEPAVEAFSLCEMKYIIHKLVVSAEPDESMPTKVSELKTYRDSIAHYSKKNCTKEENEYVYDFRGDSNFKPNSPESNAMIWAGNTIAKMCKSPGKAREKVSVKMADGSQKTFNLTDEDCLEYYKKPFETRWKKARQGLMTWVLHPRESEASDIFRVYSNTKSLLVIYPNSPILWVEGEDSGPVSFGFNVLKPGEKISSKSSFLKEFSANYEEYLHSEDFGFNEIFGLGKNNANTFEPYERLRFMVDRHTDWYKSGYDDERGRQITQAYSPLVASSYEPSKSDAFIACGYTVACVGDNPDTRKQWMFIFKIHKDNWYRTTDAAAGKQINFSKMWFDETSFGETELANEENAFDRLGTPLEGEYDSILYVHNISRNEISHDGLPQEDPYKNAVIAANSSPEKSFFELQSPPKSDSTPFKNPSAKFWAVSMEVPNSWTYHTMNPIEVDDVTLEVKIPNPGKGKSPYTRLKELRKTSNSAVYKILKTALEKTKAPFEIRDEDVQVKSWYNNDEDFTKNFVVWSFASKTGSLDQQSIEKALKKLNYKIMELKPLKND